MRGVPMIPKGGLFSFSSYPLLSLPFVAAARRYGQNSVTDQRNDGDMISAG